MMQHKPNLNLKEATMIGLIRIGSIGSCNLKGMNAGFLCDITCTFSVASRTIPTYDQRQRVGILHVGRHGVYSPIELRDRWDRDV
jgi:hypothetical protein